MKNKFAIWVINMENYWVLAESVTITKLPSNFSPFTCVGFLWGVLWEESVALINLLRLSNWFCFY